MFGDLTANTKLMKLSSLQNFSDAELENLNRDAALDDLKNDLKYATGYTDSEIDTLADNHAEFLTRALTYRQLFYYFFDFGNGENTYDETKMNYYEKEYAALANDFQKLKLDKPTRIQATQIWL